MIYSNKSYLQVLCAHEVQDHGVCQPELALQAHPPAGQDVAQVTLACSHAQHYAFLRFTSAHAIHMLADPLLVRMLHTSLSPAGHAQH